MYQNLLILLFIDIYLISNMTSGNTSCTSNNARDYYQQYCYEYPCNASWENIHAFCCGVYNHERNCEVIG